MTNEQINERIVMILGTNRTEHKYVVKSFDLPKYTNSLDLCHEFEKLLNYEERILYMHQLVHINIAAWKLSENELKVYLIYATPLQRCEAFLRLNNQWE